MVRKPVRRLWSYLAETSYPLEKAVESFIDEDIRGLVLDLNREGFRTKASCQGGEGHGWATGEVIFRDSFEPSEENLGMLRQIVRRHTSIPFKIWLDKGLIGAIVFRDPIRGKVSEGWDCSFVDYFDKPEGEEDKEAFERLRQDESFWER